VSIPKVSAFLAPCPGVDSEALRVRSLAAEITRGLEGEAERASALFAWVRDTVRYIPYAPFASLDDYEPERTLDRGYGFCTQKSALLVALARASGIRARFHFADLLNHNMPGRLGLVLGSNRMVYHTYADLMVDGRWLKVTPSFDQPLCDKMGWRLVEFHGHADATLHASDLRGRPHIEYVLDRGTDPGIPLPLMLKAWEEDYGTGALARWEEATAQISARQ
jgi:transglutaminase-like putative cysteine protease